MFAAVLAAFLAVAGGSAAARPPALPPPVAAALAQAEVSADALAAGVWPLLPGWPLGGTRVAVAGPRWLHQVDRPMAPGSAIKLLTSIVALDLLGPNWRGSTELWTRADTRPVDASQPAAGLVLAGDLVLRGGADPELGWPQLSALLAELRWQGIRRIDGDIVLDRQLFRPARMDLDLPPFDAWPEFAYNGVPDALQLDSNLMGISLAADGERIHARPWPPLPAVDIDTSALRLTDRPCREWREDWVSPPLLHVEADGRLRITLQGGFPRHCQQSPRLALTERNVLAEHLLRAAWHSLGGEWNGQVREARDALVPPLPAPPAPLGGLAAANAAARPMPAQALPSLADSRAAAAATAASMAELASSAAADAAAPMRRLARRESRPWGEWLRPLNKHSDNLLARLLYLQLALPAQAMGATEASTVLAEQAVRQWLAAQRIAADGLVLDNGSGLSRRERISARTLAAVLQAAHASRWAPEFIMSLPLAGVDGSLRQRLRQGPAAGWARLKTGTLRDVAALAGYVRDGRGQWWVLVAMLNHERAAAARPALDALVEWVANGGLRSGADAVPTRSR